MAHTTTLERGTRDRRATLASFHGSVPATRTSRPGRPAVGSAAIGDPRRDLHMFPLVAERPRVLGAQTEELPALLPPVVSEPPRRRPADLTAARSSRPVGADEALGSQPGGVSGAARPRRRLRLTLRGWAAAAVLGVAAVAATSAITIAESPQQSAPAAEYVVRSGESVEQLAARAAQGRSVADVESAIRAANGLAEDARLAAGEIVLVPGS